MNLEDVRRMQRTGERATIRPEEGYPIVGCSRGSFYQGLRDGTIPSLRLGKCYLIPVGPFLDWLGASRNEVAEQTDPGSGPVSAATG